jgi:hypothetical protein
MCQNGSKITLKFAKHHLSRMPHPPHSPDIRPCDFSLFDLLKGILKDRDFELSEQTEEVITQMWDGITFEGVRNVFQNWMSQLVCVIETAGNYIHEETRFDFRKLRGVEIEGGGDSLYTL